MKRTKIERNRGGGGGELAPGNETRTSIEAKAAASDIPKT